MFSTVGGGGVLSIVGMLRTVEDIMINVGDIISTVGGYLEYHDGYSVPWEDIMMHVGGGGGGGYHEYHEWCSVSWGGYHPLQFKYHGGYHHTCGGIS